MSEIEKTAVKNFRDSLLHTGSQVPVLEINRLMEKLTDMGAFTDLDYNSQDHNNWHCTRHAQRTVFLLSDPEVLK